MRFDDIGLSDPCPIQAINVTMLKQSIEEDLIYNFLSGPSSRGEDGSCGFPPSLVWQPIQTSPEASLAAMLSQLKDLIFKILLHKAKAAIHQKYRINMEGIS